MLKLIKKFKDRKRLAYKARISKQTKELIKDYE